MEKDFASYASEILSHIGGPDNVISVTHCMTRLRFVLRDESLCSDNDVSAIPCVISVIKQGGQYQIVIGNDVARVYSEFKKMGIVKENESGYDEKPRKEKKQNIFSRFLGYVSGSMTPLLPAMLGAGMIKVILTLLVTFNLINETGTTYSILYVIGDAFFYFLPIMLAYSIAENIGSSKMLAMLIAAILLHPDLTALFSEGAPDFFGIRVTPASYASSVLPVFIMIPILKYIEQFADKISPSIVKVFTKPLITIAIASPLALIVIGPIGTFAGNALADGVNYLYANAGWLTIMLLSAFMPFIVMTGMHYALIPIATISIASYGFDPILTSTMFCSNLAQGGASLAVSMKTKDKNLRQISSGSGISAIIAGVTEPALYGVTAKLKTPLLAACIASGAAGLFAGLRGLVAYTLGGSPSALSLIVMIGGDSLSNFTSGLITMGITLFLSFALTVILYKEKETEPSYEKKKQKGKHPEAVGVFEKAAVKTTVYSPISGVIIPISEVADETFSSGVLGEGCAVMPDDGRVFAPFDGIIENVIPTGHAIGIKSDDGCEMLIHVGKDTVSLGGKYFKTYCSLGDRVSKGDLLISFDIDSLEKEGFDTATPVIITNSKDYNDFFPSDKTRVNHGDTLFILDRKDSSAG